MSGRVVLISAEAQTEIAEAFAYIAGESSPVSAARWLDGLDELLKSLLEMPERFAIAPENQYFPYGIVRRALYHRHRVLFTVEPGAIRILHVRHGMRDDLRRP